MESIPLYHKMNDDSVKLENVFKLNVESAKQWAVEYLQMTKQAMLNENNGDMDLIVKTPAIISPRIINEIKEKNVNQSIKEERDTSPTILATSSIDIPIRKSTRIRKAPSRLGITPSVYKINKTSSNKKRLQRTIRKQNTPEIVGKCNIIKLEQNIVTDDKQNKHNVNQECNIINDVMIPDAIVESPKPKQPKTRRTTRATAETRRNSRIAAAAAQQSQNSKLGQVTRSEVLSNNSDGEDDTRFIDAKTFQKLKFPVSTNTPQLNVPISNLQKKTCLKRKSGKRRSKLANLSVSFKESEYNLSSDGDVYMSDFAQENLKKQLSADEDVNYQPIEKQAKSKVSIQKDQSKISMQLTPKLFVPVKQHAILAMDCDDDDFVDKDEEDISAVKDNIMNGNEDSDKVDSSKVDNGKEDNNKEEAEFSRTEDISDSNEQFTDACDDSPIAPVTRSLNATITLSKGDAGVAMDNSNDNRNSNNKVTNDRKVNNKTSNSNINRRPDSPVTPPQKLECKENTAKNIHSEKQKWPFSKKIEGILQSKINPNTPKYTPIIQRKKPTSVVKTFPRINSALKFRNTPMATAKTDLRTKEMLYLKEKENDERIHNLRLKRKQIADEHKKMREVKAMEAADRRELQKSTKKVALCESVKKKEIEKRQFDQRSQSFLQGRLRLERESWKKKQDEIEAKKKIDEKKRIQRILEIEAEKKQHEEIKKLKFEKSQKEYQKRKELAMLTTPLRREKLEQKKIVKENEQSFKENREKARKILRQDGALKQSSDSLSDKDHVSNLSPNCDDVPVKKKLQNSTLSKKIDYSSDSAIPVKTHASHESYDIDNLNEDSTDDESNPKNRIPNWAESSNVRKQLLYHKASPRCINDLFPKIKSPLVGDLFISNKKYRPRTSSAFWNSPLNK